MLKINLNSPEPIYEQLVHEIKRMIEHDVLKEGDSLPTIRSLASQLDVANNTVARAYQELETVGLIESSGRRGTIVTGKKINNDGEEAKIFKSAILKLLQKGFSRDEIERIFETNISLFFD
jgi:GntR family transcriptional regulator